MISSLKFPDSLNEKLFLEQYWQKAPLFMPQAWPEFNNPLSPQELAGFALEQEVPSRIIEQHSDDGWSVLEGPFSSKDFARLDSRRWTLLITDIEKHFPDFIDFVKPFRFIPDWRFDDLMISYAPPGGSVGPHMDDYDTFLLQASGERIWHLEDKFRDLPMADVDLLPDTALRLIKDFETAQSISCEVGDILYLPPRLGHYGIAEVDCMTWSFGFRAPTFHDMLIDYLDTFEAANEHKRYTDPDIDLQAYSGEITEAQSAAFKRWFCRQFNENDELFSRWMGRALSRGAWVDNAMEQQNSEDSAVKELELNSFVRVNFITIRTRTWLYAEGEEFEVSLKLARSLTEKKKILGAQFNKRDQHVISQLLAKGILLSRCD